MASGNQRLAIRSIVMRVVELCLGVVVCVASMAWSGDAWSDGLEHPSTRAIAAGRFGLEPGVGWAFAPNSATGAFLGGDVAYHYNQLLAIRIDGASFSPFNASGQARWPVNEAEWQLGLALAFVPIYARWGANGADNRFELYFVGGAGAIATRPVSVVDPTNRHFTSDNIGLAATAGVGARVFVTRSMAVSLEVRDVIYNEKQESPNVAIDPSNPSWWYSATASTTNMIQPRLGASFLLP